jgi:iron complex transport system substrate-binding protein
MVNVRKPGDYISKMIDLAGGRYCLTADDLNVEENALSTMNISMESFYELAKDADILIYNATVDGELQTLDQLLQKDSMLGEFKAFQEGKIWCSEQDMFQQTTGAADMIADLYSIFCGNGEDLTYLHALR